MAMRRAARAAGLLRQLVPASSPPLDAACGLAIQSELFASQPCSCTQIQRAALSLRHASGATSWWDNRFRPRHPSSTSTPDPSSPTTSTPDAAAEAAQAPEVWPLPEDSSEAVGAIAQAVHAGDIACIAAAKADAFFTSAWVMQGIQYLHDTQTLPWWAAIASLNIAVKAITFPLALLSQKAAAETVDTQSQMAHISALQQAAQTATSPEEAQRIQQASQRAYNEHIATHGSPFKSMIKMPAIMLGNGMVFLSVFNGVRSLMASKAFTLQTGGMAWFPDLTSYDPYYGLPMLCAASTIAMVAKGTAGDAMAVTDAQLGQRKYLKYFLYGAGLMFIPFGGMVPAGVGVLWVSNSCFSVLQGTLMRTDKFRSLCGLPSMADMKEKNRLIAAQQQSAAVAPGKGTGAAYDPVRAAAELQARVQREAVGGRLQLFAADPLQTGKGAGRGTGTGAGKGGKVKKQGSGGGRRY